MPALICVIRGRIGAQAIVREGHLRARNVQVDRQEPSGPNQQVIREDGVDGSDPASPFSEKGHPSLDLRFVHDT